MNRAGDFSLGTQRMALFRQKFKCALCGTPIFELGNAGRADHEYGEGAHAHHVRHLKAGGWNNVANCVIICQSCHYSVHEGGNYRFGTVNGTPADYPYYG